MTAQRFGEWVVRLRWWILLLTPVVMVTVASGVRNLGFSSDYHVFFGPDNPQLLAFDALQDTYTKNDNVLIAVAPKDGNVFSRENLAAVRELTETMWQVPYSTRVDSITNFQHTFAEADDLLVEDLVPDPAFLSDADLEQRRDIALSEPLLVNRIISPDASITAINVTINLPELSDTENTEVVLWVRDFEKRFEAENPGIDLYVTGIVLLNHAFFAASEDDMKTLVPLMYGAIILIMIGLLRSFSGTLGTVLVMAFSVVTTMGVAGWAGIKLTPPTASLPTIILMLAVAHSVHILVTLFHNMRSGMARHAAVVESLRVNLQPVFLTSVTTAIGFLSMNFSDVPPFHDLGNLTAAGMVAAFLYAVLFLPALMSVLPVRVKVQKDTGPGFMDRFGNMVVTHRNRLMWGSLAVIVAICAGTPLLVANEQWVEYFDKRYEFRTDSDHIAEHLTGMYLVEYSVPAGSEGAVSEPDYLANLERFANWYRAQPEVLHVNVLTDIMKRLNRNMHGDDPAWMKIPESRELSAQYLLLYEMSLPFGLDLNNQINVDKSATRMTVTLDSSIETSQILALEKRAAGWIENNLPPHMQTQAAAPVIMFAHIVHRNIDSMLTGTAVALVLISGILMFAVRSVKIGLVSLVPNLVPITMAFGLWGLTVGAVGMGTSIVASISLGIVVDDTVHFLTKYLRARREHGYDAKQAVRYAFRTVGTALWITSLVLGGGFLMLTLSGFQFNVEMGALTAIALVFALLADFLFLPTLLMRLDRTPVPAAAGAPAQPTPAGVPDISPDVAPLLQPAMKDKE